MKNKISAYFFFPNFSIECYDTRHVLNMHHILLFWEYTKSKYTSYLLLDLSKISSSQNRKYGLSTRSEKCGFSSIPSRHNKDYTKSFKGATTTNMTQGLGKTFVARYLVISNNVKTTKMCDQDWEKRGVGGERERKKRRLCENRALGWSLIRFPIGH